ncbi:MULTISPECIES: hypothetical protein [Vibrio]|uniref:hypothetical protein n=1 Tax=Vibrio TaxID=662 RepID=UPI0001F5C42A|nr:MULTISPECIES: hypothetical protein [Vibrio]ADV86365.1 hypothetical protein VVMO6_01343 [Vibrio vulnificus MO6-24/O]EGR0040878.1 hypothetical protein [Vibrio vulnificus]EGR0093360.1 hypothetical protein [Vibrio vulnificus]EGR0097856.1 hypothetical protein [Vibrio vulnificus]EGR7945118.1 hypothetical protein [Vibrio vulnificus]
MLTTVGLILNILGTILIAKFGRAVKQYNADGSESLDLQTGKQEGLFKYTEHVLLSTIGWVALLVGFVLQLIQQFV